MKTKLLVALMLTLVPMCAVQYYGQYRQDQYVYENFFQGKKDGVFVDVGAYDGVFLSNTKFFEEIGWRGLCVEPIPEVYNRLQSNRLSICIQGCVAPKRGIGQFLRCTGYTDVLSGLCENYHPDHIERIKKEQKTFGGGSEIIEVRMHKLTDLLREYQLFHVDYLTIDTEGNELDILQSIDFDFYDIEVIDVENNYNDGRIAEFLTSKGYKEVKRLGCDIIFKKIR